MSTQYKVGKAFNTALLAAYDYDALNYSIRAGFSTATVRLNVWNDLNSTAILLAVGVPSQFRATVLRTDEYKLTLSDSQNDWIITKCFVSEMGVQQ